ncbi:hypothetical protein [Streptomyces sp. ME19-01-6]|uniref:hypothetical protein n=1 Tax=Streptomyces sp. ME19-01-6 TaxID=3028686 RepID=UPI0029B9D044|nr:hypothetical protein [Streptomyces sp. ME19-01-6]MDX3224662.1 hypothetical protein [Streptomyces sp. ME19-01-6]
MSDAYSPIPELNQLKEFTDRIGQVWYSEGFELCEYGVDAGLDTWSEEPEFLAGLIPFALATRSGSHYALWRCDDRTDLATLPVVFVGDDGDLYVVARDLPELFQLLAIDEETLDPDGVEQHTEGHQEYLTWLNETFALRPPEDLDALWAGQKEYDERFKTWASRFVDDSALSASAWCR